MSYKSIAPVIASIINKNLMMIYDFCGMRNYIADKCMEHGPAFQPPNICQRVSQYNAKHFPSPKVAPVDFKTNPPIS